jgi:hypothetical protein
LVGIEMVFLGLTEALRLHSIERSVEL